MNNVQNYIKLGLIGLFVVCSAIYMFVFGPKYLSAKDARQDYLADRSFFMDQRKVAMTNLKTCYVEAQKNYDNFWARSCKSINEKQIENCVNQNVPESACKGRFQYSSSCELPTFQANAVQSYLTEQKNECNTIYKYESTPIQDK